MFSQIVSFHLKMQDGGSLLFNIGQMVQELQLSQQQQQQQQPQQQQQQQQSQQQQQQQQQSQQQQQQQQQSQHGGNMQDGLEFRCQYNLLKGTKVC